MTLRDFFYSMVFLNLPSALFAVEQPIKPITVLPPKLTSSVELSPISVPLSSQQKKTLQAPSKVLNFSAWKRAQVVEITKDVVSISKSLKKLKNLGDSKAIKQKEIELVVALEMLQFTREFKLKDYITVYLVRFKDYPQVINKVAQTLTRKETLLLLSMVLKRESKVQEDQAQPPLTRSIKKAENKPKATQKKSAEPSEIVKGKQPVEAGVSFLKKKASEVKN